MMVEFFHPIEQKKSFHQIAVVSGLVINEIMGGQIFLKLLIRVVNMMIG